MKLTPPQIALSSLCGVLALGIAYEFYAPLPIFAVPQPIQLVSAAPMPPQALFVAPPAVAFDAINNKPIFSRTRQGVAPASIGPAAPPPPPPTAALIGVIIDAQNRLALVKTPSSPLETSVAVGGQIGGWQVTDIAPDRIVLHLGLAENVIRLESNRANDAPGSSAQAGGPPATPSLQAPSVGVARWPAGSAAGLDSAASNPSFPISPGTRTQPPNASPTITTDKQN